MSCELTARWRQVDLAEHAGIHENYVSDLETWRWRYSIKEESPFGLKSSNTFSQKSGGGGSSGSASFTAGRLEAAAGVQQL